MPALIITIPNIFTGLDTDYDQIAYICITPLENVLIFRISGDDRCPTWRARTMWVIVFLFDLLGEEGEDFYFTSKSLITLPAATLHVLVVNRVAWSLCLWLRRRVQSSLPNHTIAFLMNIRTTNHQKLLADPKLDHSVEQLCLHFRVQINDIRMREIAMYDANWEVQL